LIDKELKKYFLISFVVFITIFILSIFIFPSIYQIHDPISKDKIKIMSIQDPTNFFTNLLINNLVASFIVIMIGSLGSRIIPLFFLSFNAFYIGELISVVNTQTTYLFIYAMVPHAIIELPTIILTASFGCYLAYKLKNITNSRNIFGYLKSKTNIYPVIIENGLKPYFTIVVPLIIIGCIIESYVSLYILKAIFNGV